MTKEVDSSALLPPAPNSAAVSESFRQLAELGQNDVPKLPEQMFVDHLLPMLSAPAGSEVDLSRWLDVAGTPLRAIDVVDNVTGEFLFRVPPLMRSLPTVHQAEVNYYNIIHDTQARETVHPVMAQRFLDAELSKSRTGATILDVPTAQQWNNIRARYKLPLIPIPGNGPQLASDSPASTGTLELTDDQEDF